MLFSITEKKLNKWRNKNEVNKLIQTLNHQDKVLSDKAFEFLGTIFNDKLAEKLLSSLDSQKKEIRLGAFKGLLQIPNLSVGEELLSKYNHLDKSIHPYATSLFGKMHTKEAIPLLIEQLQSDNEMLQESSLNALIQIGTPATEPLKNLYNTTKEPEIKENVAYILSQTEDPESIEILTQCIRSNKVNLISVGIEGLKNVGKSSLPVARELVKDPQTERYACNLISGIGGSEFIPDVLKIVHGDNVDSIATAIITLGHIGDQKVIDDIVNILKKDTFQDTKLSKDLTKEEKEEIISENRKKRKIRRNCITSLGNLRSSKTHQYLLDGLNDPATHDTAAEAIVQNGKELTWKALDKDKAFVKEILFIAKKNIAIENQIKGWVDEWKELN
jgi:HEAT repeat protein